MAIIKLNSPLIFGNDISPVCLPESSFAPEEEGNIVKGIVSGWGKSKSGNYSAVRTVDNFKEHFEDNFENTFGDKIEVNVGDILGGTFEYTFADIFGNIFGLHL